MPIAQSPLSQPAMGQILDTPETTSAEVRRRVLETMDGLRNGTVSTEQANASASQLQKINKRMWAEINRIRAEQSLAGVTPAVTDTAPVFLDTVTLLDQAFALLAQTHGHAGDSFRTLLPLVQDNYLSAVSDLIAQARTAAARA